MMATIHKSKRQEFYRFLQMEGEYERFQTFSKHWVLKALGNSKIIKFMDCESVANLSLEVLHDTIIKCAERMDKAPFEGNFGGYLQTSLRNSATHQIKKLEKERIQIPRSIVTTSDGSSWSSMDKGNGIVSSSTSIVELEIPWIDPLIASDEEFEDHLWYLIFQFADQKFDFMSANLFKMKFTLGISYEKMSEQTDWSSSHIHGKVQAVIKRLRKEFNLDAVRKIIDVQKLKYDDCFCD